LQVLVLEMLKAWGDAGLRNHVEDMQRSYARRAAVTIAAADKHLYGLASWRAPQVQLT
jgi:kynurenine/2-aminoadipate aminotransferase